METIPIELVLQILFSSDATSIIRLCQTNKRIWVICTKYHNLIWTKKCNQDYARWKVIDDPKTHYFNIKNGFHYRYTLYVPLEPMEGQLATVQLPKNLTSYHSPIYFKICGNPPPTGSIVYVVEYDLAMNSESWFDFVTKANRAKHYTDMMMDVKYDEGLVFWTREEAVGFMKWLYTQRRLELDTEIEIYNIYDTATIPLYSDPNELIGSLTGVGKSINITFDYNGYIISLSLYKVVI